MRPRASNPHGARFSLFAGHLMEWVKRLARPAVGRTSFATIIGELFATWQRHARDMTWRALPNARPVDWRMPTIACGLDLRRASWTRSALEATGSLYMIVVCLLHSIWPPQRPKPCIAWMSTDGAICVPCFARRTPRDRPSRSCSGRSDVVLSIS
jgi:hypothetical protein